VSGGVLMRSKGLVAGLGSGQLLHTREGCEGDGWQHDGRREGLVAPLTIRGWMAMMRWQRGQATVVKRYRHQLG
jgi:hypothetical protein